MCDGGYYAIKGFEFQIDKTILELFKAKDNTPIFLEQIQDINSSSFVTQVKYKETQQYTLGKIKEPVIQLINEYQLSPHKKYYLYCYFNNMQEGSKTLTSVELDKILGNKKSSFTQSLKDGFLTNFELHFAKNFQEHFLQAVEIIKKNVECSDFDEALIHYGSITNHLRKLVVNNPVVADRTCTKSEIIHLITNNRKIVFDSAYRIYKGEQQYLAAIKKKHFTYRNIDDWERFIIIELQGNENISSIKTIVNQIKNKFYRRQVRAIKSGAPYIHIRNTSSEKLKQLKSSLVSDGVVLIDGYNYMASDFNLEAFRIKSTLENGISIKIINTDEILSEITACDLKCAKKVYQFYLSAPLAIATDIDEVSIEIKTLNEIQQILS